MTTNLNRFKELEQSVKNSKVPYIEYGNRRFVVVGLSDQPHKFLSYDFTQMLWGELIEMKIDAKVFFEHEDGKMEDFTEYFIAPQPQRASPSMDQKSAINSQGKVLVNILKTKNTSLWNR